MGDPFEKRVLIARSRVDGRRNRRFTRIANRNFHATSCFADAPSNVRIRRGPQGRSVLDGTADDRQAASAATFCRCQFQGRSS
jgi:hypothetical protein